MQFITIIRTSILKRFCFIIIFKLYYNFILLDNHQHSVARLTSSSMDVNRRHNFKKKKMVVNKYKEFTKGEKSFTKNFYLLSFFIYSLFNVYVHIFHGNPTPPLEKLEKIKLLENPQHIYSMIIQSYATAVQHLENLSTAVLIKINQSDLFRTQHFDNMLDPNVQRKKSCLMSSAPRLYDQRVPLRCTH